MDNEILIWIVLGLAVLFFVVYIGIECGSFDHWFKNLVHPDPGPDLVFKPMEIRARRCQECNSIITGLNIVIVRDDDHVQISGAIGCGLKEVELYEAIYCEHCGHQNIVGKYHRHASDDINLKAQIARKDSQKNELTPNMMRVIMGLKPIQSEEQTHESNIKKHITNDHIGNDENGAKQSY